MTGRIFMGVETEYALGPIHSRGRGSAAEQLLNEAMRTLPHLPAYGESGIYLTTGGRMYVDCGQHPEYATPECDDPRELVASYAAGDQLVVKLLGALDNGRSDGVQAFKSNVCYENSEATFGAHESYSVHRPGGAFTEQLIPFLTSRIVFTGAGGLDPKSPGIVPCLSPRVVHLVQDVSGSSTERRGIFHLRDEPLARNGWHRVHVLSGDAARSPRAAWLRVGTTALVLALVDAGEQLWDWPPLASAVKAMQAFNTDLSLQVRSPLKDGRALSALAIQRVYLQAAEARRGHPALPCWADELLAEWRKTLELLTSDAAALETRFDWAVKRALFGEHSRQRGFPAEKLAAWNIMMADWQRELPPTGGSVLDMLGKSAANPRKAPECPAGAAPGLTRAGSSWDELPAFLRLRAELCEIDLRYSLLGPGSIHAQLSERGLLDQAMPAINGATRAESPLSPPTRGRARLRGDCVREFAGRAGYTASWTGICNAKANLQLLLPEPTMEERPAWTPHEPPPERSRISALFGDRLRMEVLSQLSDADHFVAAMERRTTDAATWANYAVLLKNELNDFRNAERCYLHSLELGPGVAGYLGNYALFLTSCVGRHDEAEQHFRQALELDRRDGSNLGNFAFFRQNVHCDFSAAENLYEEALRTGQAEDVFVLTNFASLRLVQGREGDALALLRRAELTRQPVNGRARPRLLFLRAVIELQNHSAAGLLLGGIKGLFANGVAGGPWSATTLEEYVGRRLEGEEAALCLALLRAIGYLADREALERFPLWRALPESAGSHPD